MTTTPQNAAPSISARAILGASAFLLAGLTILQAGRLPANTAYAEAANSGTMGYSLATVRSGLGPDTKPYELLYLLDSRGESLFIYFIENYNDGRMLLRYGTSLPELFRQGRGG